MSLQLFVYVAKSWVVFTVYCRCQKLKFPLVFLFFSSFVAFAFSQKLLKQSLKSEAFSVVVPCNDTEILMMCGEVCRQGRVL